jgi:excisionase family DNA binding protein
MTNTKPNYRRDAMNRYQMHLPFSPGATMTTLQVGDILNCSDETVRKMCQEGELKAYQLRPVPKSPWRVYKDSVAQLLERIRDEYDLHSLDTSTNPAKPSAHPNLGKR